MTLDTLHLEGCDICPTFSPCAVQRSNQTSNASPRLNERAQSPEPLAMPGDERLGKPKAERRRATPSPVPIDPSMPRM
jgi:hypothetical protein